MNIVCVHYVNNCCDLKLKCPEKFQCPQYKTKSDLSCGKCRHFGHNIEHNYGPACNDCRLCYECENFSNFEEHT
jgi:hypothetical protein